MLQRRLERPGAAAALAAATMVLMGFASAAEPARRQRVLAIYESEAARPVNVAFASGLRGPPEIIVAAGAAAIRLLADPEKTPWRVRFREPSPWNRHRWSIAIVFAVLAVQSALIAGLLVQRRARRRAEASARENLAVVAHLNRVGAVGELAGSLAHELNSPLGAVLNNAQAARRMVSRDAQDLRECLDDIVQDAQRAGEVIRRMRGALRRESFRPSPVDVAAVVRDAVRLVEADARDRDVVLAVDVDAALPPVSGDDVQLAQVVLNLVMNGIDALARTPRERRRVRIRAVAQGHRVEISVTDSGPGISRAERERVFEPFYSTKPAGLGMGLAISRSIVEAHGGTIAVDAAPGGGARFHVFLPAAQPRRDAKEAV